MTCFTRYFSSPHMRRSSCKFDKRLYSRQRLARRVTTSTHNITVEPKCTLRLTLWIPTGVMQPVLTRTALVEGDALYFETLSRKSQCSKE